MDMKEYKTGADLATAWDALLEKNAAVRAVDAAEQLGVSEAQLIASRVGNTAIKLGDSFGDVLISLQGAGNVMVLTRNASVVHEKVGEFGKVTIQPGHAIVLNHDIDLRLFMGQWRHGFSLSQPLKDGSIRRSFQFFDASGRAVHKIFARPETDMTIWQTIEDGHRASEQVDQISCKPLPGLPVDLADAEIDAEGLRSHWAELRDVHDFFGLLKDFKVGRHQSLRLVGDEFATQVKVDSAKKMLELAAQGDVPIMCFVGNGGCIQIHTGPVKRVEQRGPWLNVLDPGFNMHLRADHIVAAWIVRKPTSDGTVTSLELFDAQNRNVVMFFGARKPGQTELTQWRDILAQLESTGEIAA